MPQSIYIISGAKEGYNKLFKIKILSYIAKKCRLSKAKILEMNELPEIFHRLTPYEIHNFLCAYRDYFGNIYVVQKDKSKILFHLDNK